MWFSVIQVVLLATILMATLYICIKVYRIHEKEYGINDSLYRASGFAFQQTESLLAIYKDLGFKKSIPKTRGFAASPDFLRQVYEQVLSQKPDYIVECSSGISTLIAAQSLSQIGSGHVYSLESDKYYCDQTRRILVEHGVAEWATVVHAPLKGYEIDGIVYKWYEIDSLNVERIDLLVVDGPFAGVNKLARYPAGRLLANRFASNVVLLVDDYNRFDEKKMVAMWLEENENLQKEVLDCEKGAVKLLAESE